MVFWGSDEEYAYLASGLTEEIVIALTRFPELVVVGPLNRERLRRKHLGPRGIGQEYQVRFVLDGTVRVRSQLGDLVASNYQSIQHPRILLGSTQGCLSL